MRIEIAVVQGRARVQHIRLAQRLRDAGHATRVVPRESREPPTPGVDLLMMFEDLLYGPLTVDFLARADAGHSGFEGAADVLIDLSDGAAVSAAPVLFPVFDGLVGESAAIAALLDGRSPNIVIARRSNDETFGDCIRGLAAIERPYRFKDSLNRVVARLNDLIVKAIQAMNGNGEPLTLGPAAHAGRVGISASLMFAAASLAGRITERLNKLSGGGEAWRAAWRRANNDEVRRTHAWPGANYAILPDDGAR